MIEAAFCAADWKLAEELLLEMHQVRLEQNSNAIFWSHDKLTLAVTAVMQDDIEKARKYFKETGVKENDSYNRAYERRTYLSRKPEDFGYDLCLLFGSGGWDYKDALRLTSEKALSYKPESLFAHGRLAVALEYTEPIRALKHARIAQKSDRPDTIKDTKEVIDRILHRYPKLRNSEVAD